VDPTARADLSRTWALVPIRGLETAKTRLGGDLDPEERAALVTELLRRTLAATRDARRIAGTVVVTMDGAAAEIARRHHAVGLVERAPGLNGAIEAARSVAQARGARAVLVLPADLPLLATASLDRLLDAADAALAAGSGSPLVAIAPSDARNGTNALLLFPVDVIAPAFGERSLEAHVRAAAAVDATLQVVTDPGLGFDLDTPEDIEMLPPGLLQELVREGQAALAGIERGGRGAA